MDDNGQDKDERSGSSHKDMFVAIMSDMNGTTENSETKALLDFTSEMEERLTSENSKLGNSIEILQARVSQLESNVISSSGSIYDSEKGMKRTTTTTQAIGTETTTNTTETQQLFDVVQSLEAKISKVEGILANMPLQQYNKSSDNDDLNSSINRSKAIIDFEKDEDENEANLPEDTFSFLVIAPTCSTPFFSALIVFCFQIWVFLLVVFSLLNPEDSTNPLDIPVNVEEVVRIAQVVAIVIAVLTQDDMTKGLNMLVEGYNNESLKASFEYAAWWKWKLSVVTRLLEGGFGLVVTFMLIMTSETVIDLLLNFTAMEFVSQLDDVCFFMSQQGFFGKKNKYTAAAISEITYCRMHRARNLHRIILLIFLFVNLWAGFVSIVYNQATAKYLCSTVLVQFSDEFSETLGTFSGLYDLRRTATITKAHVQYVDRQSGLAVFAYCNDLQAWTFGYDIGGDVNPCDWVVRSSETKTYDLTKTASLEWVVRDSMKREVILHRFYISCYDCESSGADDCGGRGSCKNAVCSCNDGWHGLRCEFPEPCPILQFDDRFGAFGGNHKWSTTFKRLEIDYKPVDAYFRPIYFNEYSPGQFDIIVFGGRRWAATFSNILGIASENGQTTKEALAKHFHEGFHPGLFHFSMVFVSEPLDVGTPFDTNSPVGIQWFSLPQVVVNSTNAGNHGSSIRTKTPIEAILLCSECNSELNRCLYDGQCINGTCHCSMGATGALCQVPPVGNGHCDSFYNTLEFEYDGGDCCESTCVSSDFTCGADESGFDSRGYYFCHLPAVEWRLSGEPMQGEATSGSGYTVALSGNSVILAVGEPMADRVKLFDKDGSQWVQRGRTIDGPADSMFGSSLALSAGSMHRVNNPVTVAPISFVAGTSFTSTGYLFVFDCDENDCSQVGSDLVVFEHEVAIAVVVDISSDGGVVAAGAASHAYAQYQSLDGFFPLAVFERGISGEWIRRKLNLVFETSEFVYSVSLSGNGNVLAFGSYMRGFSPERGSFIENDIKRVYKWNGNALNSRGPSIVDTNPHDSLLFNLQGRSIALSDDGNVLGLGLWRGDDLVSTRILAWDERRWDWIQRGSTIGCGDFGGQGWSIALSSDGAVVAIGSSNDTNVQSLVELIGLNGTVCTFTWNGTEWEPRGSKLLGGYRNSVALSSDGSSLAVGLPYSSVSLEGMSAVYIFPHGTCADGTSLLRISLTTDSSPQSTTWDVMSNVSGEVVLSGGTYHESEIYASFVEEICITTSICHIFTIYDMLDLTNEMKGTEGMNAPGGYSLFLDGTEITKRNPAQAVDWVFIGNCMECPVGTKLFRMLIQTCIPVSWTFQDSSSQTLFSNNSFSKYPDNLSNNCSFAMQTTYWEELCVSLDHCSLFTVSHPPQQLYDFAKVVDSSNSVPNLGYRLFVEHEQISGNTTTTVFSNSNESEPIVSVSVGNCVR